MLGHGPMTLWVATSGNRASGGRGWTAEGDVIWLVGHVASPKGRHVFVSAVRSPPGRSPSRSPALSSAIDALKAQGLP